MTCFRRKEEFFVLTAQRPDRRVPVLHRIPLFSRTRMRVRLSGSRICHKISRVYRYRPNQTVVSLFPSMPPMEKAALRECRIRPKRNLTDFCAKHVQGGTHACEFQL